MLPMDNTSGILSMTEPHIRGQACTLYFGCSTPSDGLSGKDPTNAGDIRDVDLIPGLGVGNSNPLQYFLPGESHGQRSLVGNSPWGHREMDMTELT